MAGVGGFFLKGLAGGLQGLGQQVGEWKWQKKERDRIQKEKDDVAEAVSAFNQKIENYYADEIISDEERLQLTTAYLASAYNVQEVIKGSYDAALQGNRDVVNQNLQYLKFWRESIGDMNPDDIPALHDWVKNQMQGEKSKSLFDAETSLLKKKYETKQEEEEEERKKEETKDPTIANYTTATNYLKSISNISPENFERARTDVGGKFGIDTSYITQEMFKEMNTATKKYYNTAEEAMASGPDIPNMKKVPVQMGANQWKLDYEKETGVGGTGTTTPVPFKTLQNIKEEFKNVKTKVEYDSALQSYNASKEAKASDWTPPPFDSQLVDLIKKVEEAIWADFVTKAGKLKDKNEAESYNTNLQHYLKLIEEAKNAGIDVSQFQTFIPYKGTWGGIGNPLVTKESW